MILYINRKYIATTLPIMPVFYVLVPQLYILCYFSHIPVFHSQTVYLFLPYLASRSSIEMPVDRLTMGTTSSGKHALVPAGQTSTSLCVSTVEAKWLQTSTAFHNCSCLQSRVVMTCWDPEWEICNARMEASETFIKGPKVPWLSKAVSVRQCGAAIKWKKGKKGTGRPLI